MGGLQGAQGARVQRADGGLLFIHSTPTGRHLLAITQAYCGVMAVLVRHKLQVWKGRAVALFAVKLTRALERLGAYAATPLSHALMLLLLLLLCWRCRSLLAKRTRCCRMSAIRSCCCCQPLMHTLKLLMMSTRAPAASLDDVHVPALR
jgi:hypothetical protein